MLADALLAEEVRRGRLTPAAARAMDIPVHDLSV